MEMKIVSAKVKVSPKFQIVIPKAIREEMHLQPGQELLLYLHDGSLRLDPPRSIRELRGIAKGIRWEPTDRNRNDRF
jgi:AbrB family looped-hinge helix DNA binding protein